MRVNYNQRENNPFWKGGRMVSSKGYVMIRLPEHPRAIQGYVPEQVLVCEKALGKFLPVGSMPHHVNGKRKDNRPENLVLCQDSSYHQFLHLRMRAFKACGHANWRKCWICKQWDPPEKLKIRGRQITHVSCQRTYWNEQYEKGRD